MVHGLNFDKTTIYQSFFGPLATEHVVSFQKNNIPTFKLANLIVSYNNIPLLAMKILFHNSLFSSFISW